MNNSKQQFEAAMLPLMNFLKQCKLNAKIEDDDGDFVGEQVTVVSEYIWRNWDGPPEPAKRDADTGEYLEIWTMVFLRHLYQIDPGIEPGIAGMGSSDGHTISALRIGIIRNIFENLVGYSVDDNPDNCDGITGKPFKEFCVTTNSHPDRGFTVYWDNDEPDYASLNWFV